MLRQEIVYFKDGSEAEAEGITVGTSVKTYDEDDNVVFQGGGPDEGYLREIITKEQYDEYLKVDVKNQGILGKVNEEGMGKLKAMIKLRNQRLLMRASFLNADILMHSGTLSSKKINQALSARGIGDTDKLVQFQPFYHAQMQLMKKGLPDDVSRKWQALSAGSQAVIESGTASGESHPDGGDWGNIQDLSAKKDMLQYVGSMSAAVEKVLQSATSSKMFAKAFVDFRNSLDEPLEFIEPTESVAAP